MKIHESYKYVVWIILLLIISPNVRSQIDKNKKQINVLDFGAIPNDGEFSKNNFDDSFWDSWLPRNTSKESRNSGSFEAVLTHENGILSDGVIWFRTKIKLENIESEYNLIIEEGIDDLDQTYFNGQLIGSTIGWDKARNYKIPKQILIKGENTIAIRVFDGGGPGGINGIIKVRNSLSSQVIPFSSFKFKHQAFIANKKLWVHNYSFEDLIKNSSMLQKNIKREIIKLNNYKNDSKIN
jgi:hypothetical protein